jgi:hypothetical protein
MSTSIANVYSDESDNAPTSVMVAAQQSREIAEIQSAMTLAKRFPRDQKHSLDKILIACQRKTLAEVATYNYARGGTDITGPSIRLAEAIAREWGNLQCGVKELEQRDGESTVEAFAIDLETNYRCCKVFQVKHVRNTRSGSYEVKDQRDIYEMVANQGARRLRSCILGVIPGDVVEAAVEQCEATLKAKCDTSPEAIKKLLEAFAAMQITKEMVEGRIQRTIEAITPAQFINMRKIFNSIKDGMSKAADWFPVAEEPQGAAPGTKPLPKNASIKPTTPEAAKEQSK